jgi:hypothetical protein
MKTQEIRDAGLPFISAGFAPAVVTGEDFIVERQKLVLAGRDALRIIISDVDPGQCQDWADEHDDLVGNLDRKALAICHGNSTDARKLRDQFIQHYLQGRNALEKLRSQYPNLYETVFRIKQDKEHFLATESLIPDSLPPQKMQTTLKAFNEELSKALPGMANFTIAQLVHEAVSDWLLRCPLNFPNTNSTNAATS